MLHADVTKGLHVVFRSSDPTKAFTKGVIGIHDIPMASGVWD
jgi:hypothetical protein